MCLHAHLYAFSLGRYFKKGDEFRSMHMEAQLAQDARQASRKANDSRAGCYKLDSSHTQIPSLFNTHTRARTLRISSLCAVSYPPLLPQGILSALSSVSRKCG